MEFEEISLKRLTYEIMSWAKVDFNVVTLIYEWNLVFSVPVLWQRILVFG